MNNPQKKLKTIGVILDATRPYKTESSKDYITKLKIIDESVNSDSDISQKKYIHVFVFNNHLQDAPYIEKIGDIIYLKRYDVKKIFF